MKRFSSDPLALLMLDELYRDNVEISKDCKNGVVRIAVQVSEDPIYYGLFSKIIVDLTKRSNVLVDLVVTRSINGAVGNSILHRIARHPILGQIIASKWIRLYSKLSPKIGYRSVALNDVFYDLQANQIARSLFRNLNNGTLLINNLEIDNILVGDLVVDTYLRFRPKAYFDVSDRFVKKILIQTCKDVRRARRYFTRFMPSCYLTSYTTYIQHGIPVRVALSMGISVYSFGSFQHFVKKHDFNDVFHTPFTDDYKSLFNVIPDKAEALKLAELGLNNRLSGGKDSQMAFMKTSAYSDNADIGFDVSGHCIIFLHDFYDSPHVYSNMVFDDFWTWTLHTINFLKANGIKFAVKPHPNQCKNSEKDVEKLKSIFPDLRIIPSAVSNKKLVDAGIRCGVSVYGTVAHELAFLGVPTVCCAKHPHSSFDFCLTGINIYEYEQYLLNAVAKLSPSEMRNQSMAFYYMHNLYGDVDSLKVRALWGSYFLACESHDAPRALDDLKEIGKSNGYKRLLSQLSS